MGLDKPLTKVERDIQRLKKAVYDFLQIKAPPQRPAQRLLELYATLTDKTPSTNFGGMPIWFYINTPLTKAELLYAIETTFQLNDLTIVALDDETITLQKGGTKPGTPGGNPKPSSAAKAPPVK